MTSTELAEELGVATDRPMHLEDRALLGHPRGLALLFVVEMWERFSFYGMRALLVLYMVHVLGWADARADHLYGTYTALVYLTALGGGYLADRFIGTRRSVVIGGIIIAAGHFTLAMETLPSFYTGLGLVVIGTGFFKPNVSTMVGQIYAPRDTRRDAGFTIFYMGINLGAFIAPLICGYFAQDPRFQTWLAAHGLNPAHSWRWGFAAAGVGMVIGLATYLWFRERYLPGIGVRQPSAALGVGRAASSPQHGALTADERRRLVALAIVFFFAVFFWVGYEQAGSSLNLFADRYTRLRVLGASVPSSWFQSLQPLFVLLLAPMFAYLWRWLGTRNAEPSTSLKMAYGLVLIGLGYVFMVVGGHVVDTCLATHPAASACAVASPVWLTSFYLFSVLGELCLSPVGLSYVTKVAPVRFASFLMGAWFLTNASANYIAGALAAATARVPTQAQFFVIPLGMCLVAAALMFVLVPTLKRLTASVAA